MIIFSFGGASLTILRNRLTKGSLSFNIRDTVDSCKRVLHVLGH